MTSPVPPSAAPPPKSSSGPLYTLIGCLAVLFIGLLAAAAVVVFVWRPWAPDVKPPPPGTVEGTVTTGEITQTDEGSQEGSEATTGASSLELIAGNAGADGAHFKLFGEAGLVIGTGQLPVTVDVPADAKYKLAVSADGYRPWEQWQTIGAAGSAQSVTVTLEKLPPDMVAVTVCTQTGRRANDWCPVTTRREFEKGKEPGVCTLHKAPPGKVAVALCTTTGKRANRYCPMVVTRVFDVNRVPGYCTLHKAPQNQVGVKICTASGQRANEFCPTVVTRTFDANRVPGYCTLHKAPPPPQNTITTTICLDTGKLATKNCQRTGQKTFPANAVPGYCTACRPPPPGKPKATVRICDESSQRAGRYCTSTHTVRMDADAIPPSCQMHTEPPGQSQDGVAQYKTCPECGARNRENARMCRKCRHRF
jgi:hypothetical protein